MEEAIDTRLRFAVANRRLIQLTYHGTRRVVEPHDYGLQKGARRLLVYQLRTISSNGGSASSRAGGEKGWRLLDVSKIEECAVLDETFRGSRGNEHHAHHVWDTIYARVA
jgi:hypothetical protein